MKIISTTKTSAVEQPTVPPALIVTSNLIDVPDDEECCLPDHPSLKKTIRRRRRKDDVARNPDLALADERSLLSLTIPAPLLQPWKIFDSGPGPDRVLILTTNDKLDLLCQSFVPVADVIPTFESISTQFLQDELPLLAYFEKTWIETPVGTRRLAADFPSQMWNALERSSTGSTRTTNALEAYHHAFNALISC